jgi:hypothetical protein
MFVVFLPELRCSVNEVSNSMREEEARLALLQAELSAIQNSIITYESITFQIKSWCVTTSLAVGGFAIASHNSAVILIGEAAVVGFFLINCQFKMYQHYFIAWNGRIDSELKDVGIMGVLKGAGCIDILGTTNVGFKTSHLSIAERVRVRFPSFWHEVNVINTFNLYLFITLCFLIEAIVLLS